MPESFSTHEFCTLLCRYLLFPKFERIMENLISDILDQSGIWNEIEEQLKTLSCCWGVVGQQCCARLHGP